MSKRDVILFLFKWKFSLIGYFLFVVVLATAFAYLMPPKYSAKAVLMIESNRSPVLNSDIAFGVDESIALNSELAIITSHTVLSNAVDSMNIERQETEESSDLDISGSKALNANLADNESFWDMGAIVNSIGQLMTDLKSSMIEIGLIEPMTVRQSIIRKLEKDLVIEPIPGSTIIKLSLNGGDPKWITKMINSVTDNYIDHHLKVFSSPGSTEFFQIQLDHLESELRPLRQRLDNYKKRNNLSAIEESMQALVKRRAELLIKQDEALQEKAQLQTIYTDGHSKIVLINEKIADIKGTLQGINAKLRRLDLHQEKTEDMRTQIDSFEKSFLDYQKRYEEARMRDLANTEVVNVRIIEYATEPTRPNHSRIFYIVLAMIGGMMLSIVISLIKEYFDHRISDSNRIEMILGIPVLGSIKKF